MRGSTVGLGSHFTSDLPRLGIEHCDPNWLVNIFLQYLFQHVIFLVLRQQHRTESIKCAISALSLTKRTPSIEMMKSKNGSTPARWAGELSITWQQGTAQFTHHQSDDQSTASYLQDMIPFRAASRHFNRLVSPHGTPPNLHTTSATWLDSVITMDQ